MISPPAENPHPVADETCDTPAIRVCRLTHRYPSSARVSRRNRRLSPETDTPQTALDDVSFEVQAGEIFGVLGPNGSGKTTMFRILSTLMRPTRGQAAVFGYDLALQPHEARRQLGVVFQTPSLDGKLTAWENLLHQGHLYGLHNPALSARMERLLHQFGLIDRSHECVERFSGGMRRRVELAKALLHHPRLLLLDEPATGLDLNARRDVWTILRRLVNEQHMTVALTTHLMEDADHCDRLAILAGGRLAALDTPAHLKARIGGDVIHIEPDDNDAPTLCAAIARQFGPWPAGAEPRVVDHVIRFERPRGAEFVATVAGIFPGRIRSITVGRPTLEDVFVHLTGQAIFETRQGS